MTCPLFSPLAGFCPAAAQKTVTAKARDASADFRIGDLPRNRIYAKSSFAWRDGQRWSSDKTILPNKKGGNKSRPMIDHL
jgi:hypothetical protein